MPLKIGSFVFATEQGLGCLAKSFFDNGIVTDVLCIQHRSRPSLKDKWYQDATETSAKNTGLLCQFASGMDIMLFFETPFDWNIIDYCRQKNIKTIIMPMHECMPRILPTCPDYWLAPSLLDRAWCSRYGFENREFIPVPVDVTWGRRHKALTYVHNAGHGGLLGRNGTLELIQALPYVKSPIYLILRYQERFIPDLPDKSCVTKVGNVTVDWRYGTEDKEHLWCHGDVFVFPERFNGLSLPLQEARAAGMLVMATDRYPMNAWLRNEALIPVSKYQTSQVSPNFTAFDDAVVEPKSIAAMMDWWYGRDIESYSESGRYWAETMSWKVLGPKYMETLTRIRGI